MTEYGWQIQRTPTGEAIMDCDAFLIASFDIIAETKASMMLEARNKQ